MKYSTTEPLISVTIPAFNHERYVGECVRSILAQDWPRMELLIVDDGSRDETWKRVQDLTVEARASGKFERVEIETQANRGTCATLNRLLSMSRGDIVAIIASDDKYLPSAFAALMKPMLSDPSVGVVVGQNGFMDADSRECFWDREQNVVYEENLSVYRTFNEYLGRLSGVKDNDEGFGRYENLLRCNHIANGFLIRRSFLDQVLPFRKEAPLEDHWLHLQLSKICRYRAIPEMTFRYRWHTMNSVRQTARMMAFRYRTLKYEERITGHPVVQERVKFSIAGIASVRKIETLEEIRKVLRLFGRTIVLKRKPILSEMQLRCLIVVHVYYQEYWRELAECIRNIDDPSDIIITFSDETQVAQARKDFPQAQFLQCENVGYDVWPFIKAIQSANLDDYEVIIKLHTKRDMPLGQSARPFNGFLVDGSRWRNQLLRFIRTPENWALTKKQLADPRIGMVADRWMIVKERGVCFVAGTMFAVKASVLKTMKFREYEESQFSPANDEHMGGFAHKCERDFGVAVRAAGLQIAGFSGKEMLFALQRILEKTKGFIYRKKMCSDGAQLVKVCKIPIYRGHPKG